MKKRYWTKLEEDMLYKRYIEEGCTRIQIALELNRTEGSIKTKLRDKGWKRKFQNNPYSNKSSLSVELLEIKQTISVQKENLKISEWALNFYEENEKKPTRRELAEAFPDIFPNYRKTIKYILENNLSQLFRTQTESNFEIFISEVLDQLEYSYVEHYRDGLEIDFYIPEIGVGIEMNDTGSHNTTIGFKGLEQPKEKLYHQEKTLFFFNKGIKIIHIYEKDLARDNFIKYLKREISQMIKVDNIVLVKEPFKWKEKYNGENVVLYDDGIIWGN